MSNSKGYSLIELVIVVGLLSVLSISISAIVLMTIANSHRIRNQVRIREIGDYAIGQISTLVRNARLVTACNSTNDILTIRGADGGTTILEGIDTNIASNSAEITPVDVKITNFNIDCLPADSDPRLIKISFTAERTDPGPTRENPIQNFATSIEIRNQ